MRPIDEIKNDITELTERRTHVWRELANGESDAETVAQLTEQIDELWNELRATRVIAAHGTPDIIRRRADRERRIEIELDRNTTAGVTAEAA